MTEPLFTVACAVVPWESPPMSLREAKALLLEPDGSLHPFEGRCRLDHKINRWPGSGS